MNSKKIKSFKEIIKFENYIIIDNKIIKYYF